MARSIPVTTQSPMLKKYGKFYARWTGTAMLHPLRQICDGYWSNWKEIVTSICTAIGWSFR